MAAKKGTNSKVCNKQIAIPLFDIREDGVCVGLNHVVKFQRHGTSHNVSMQSMLLTCRGGTSINVLLEDVFI